MVTDNKLIVDFTAPVSHAGFDLFWFDVGFPLANPGTVQIYAADDVTLLYSTNIFEPFAPDFYFFGYSDSRGIGSIVLFRDEGEGLGVSPMIDIPVQMRGWTLDVLNIVRRLVESRRRGDESLNEKSTGQPESLSLLTSSPTNEFTTADAYAFTRELEKLHPDNRHVKDKIRQQLQVLRDAGLLLHVERGLWRLP